MGREWNPKRLDMIEAYEEQIVFFENNPDVKIAQIKRFLGNLNNSLRKIESSGNHVEYKKIILKKMQEVLLKYRKQIPWRDVPEIAERAFPRYMYCYWFVNAQINKIRKRIHK